MLYLFFTCRKFFHTTAVYNVNFFCTKTFCTAGCVHGNVSTTDNSNFFRMLDRSFASVLVSFHKVDTGQKLIGGINTFETLARNIHKSRKTSTRTDKDRFISHLKQFIDCKNFSDHHISLDRNTDRF